MALSLAPSSSRKTPTRSNGVRAPTASPSSSDNANSFARGALSGAMGASPFAVLATTPELPLTSSPMAASQESRSPAVAGRHSRKGLSLRRNNSSSSSQMGRTASGGVVLLTSTLGGRRVGATLKQLGAAVVMLQLLALCVVMLVRPAWFRSVTDIMHTSPVSFGAYHHALIQGQGQLGNSNSGSTVAIISKLAAESRATGANVVHASRRERMWSDSNGAQAARVETAAKTLTSTAMPVILKGASTDKASSAASSQAKAGAAASQAANAVTGTAAAGAAAAAAATTTATTAAAATTTATAAAAATTTTTAAAAATTTTTVAANSKAADRTPSVAGVTSAGTVTVAEAARVQAGSAKQADKTPSVVAAATKASASVEAKPVAAAVKAEIAAGATGNTATATAKATPIIAAAAGAATTNNAAKTTTTTTAVAAVTNSGAAKTAANTGAVATSAATTGSSFPPFVKPVVPFAGRAAKPPPIVGVVFYGRRERVRILDCYLQRNMARNGGLLTSVVFVVATWQPADVAFLDRLLALRGTEYRKLYPERVDKGYTGHYKWMDPGTMYVKMDDDVVYIADEAIDRMLLAHNLNKYHLISANVINHQPLEFPHSQRGAHMQYEQTKPGDKASWRPVMRPVTTAAANTANGTAAATTTTLQPLAYMDNGWDVWGDWRRAANVHYSFLANQAANRLNVYDFPNGEQLWDFNKHVGYIRWRINMIMFKGATIDVNKYNMSSTVGTYPGDDEDYITRILPQQLNRTSAAVSGALAVHFSFYMQRAGLENSTDLLDRYTLLAEQTCGRLVPA